MNNQISQIFANKNALIKNLFIYFVINILFLANLKSNKYKLILVLINKLLKMINNEIIKTTI